MLQIIQTLVKAIVDHPEQVRVEQVEGAHGVIYEVRVAPDDLGQVIGRGGRTANAMRAVARAAGAKTGQNVWIDVNRLPEE